MNYRDAVIQDIEKIEHLLKECSLPYNDLHKYIDNIVVVEVKEQIIGVGGFEIHGRVSLIRSLAVSPEYRDNGVGKKIYALLERNIANRGINKLFLLTETAAEYFEKIGFIIREREQIPVTITQTKQFRELCPSTAVIMYYELRESNE